ncbi:MAG: penicillin-binding protein 2, partial [Tetragenococcus koreensis]|nr:penicillin-binding protein 2 [Tetragenococcus koreensis]
ALSTVNIKNNEVTEKEIAAISEYSDSLPGITTGTDWKRNYPQESSLRSILGSVSSEKQGIPEAEEKKYLAKGYSRNDRVGRSLIEYEYETILRGSKSISKTETDKAGDILTQSEIYPGAKGDNLLLTIDMDFQNRVDNIVEDILSKRRGLNNGVYAVALNPKNGEVLAMSGKSLVEGEIKDDSLGTISKSFEMGSSIKAATVLAGYMDGVITLDDNVIVDRPLKIKGSRSISSVFNRYGSEAVNDITSLQKSSNVYMATLAMRMGGYWNYQQNQGLPIDGQKTADKMRSYYQQFGLGSTTGIDLPNEATGQVSDVTNAGEALFYSFGQFDTYTPMQLAQYISTIANGGVRYAPHLVSEVRKTNPKNGEIGALSYEVEPKIMNTIDLSETEFERVQKGLYEVLNGSYGFAPSIFSGTPYTAAGKTGTAQASYWGDQVERRNESVTNITFAGFAPYEDPEIAVAVVIPYLPNDQTGTDHVGMTRDIMDAYFEVGDFKDEEPTEIEED